MAQTPSPQTQQEIIARFENLREEAQSIASNLGDRRAESRVRAILKPFACQNHCKACSIDLGLCQEHSLVVSTLQPLDADRKCYRQVGDVLIQRTVAEVLPDVKGNAEQLDQVRTRCLHSRSPPKRLL